MDRLCRKRKLADSFIPCVIFIPQICVLQQLIAPFKVCFVADIFYFQGADIVIALTHMRWPNDRKVANEVDVDMVLGGHDHDYIVEKVRH